MHASYSGQWGACGAGGGVAAGWGRTDGVPPVLDRVVGSARQLLGDERPLRAHLLHELHDELLLLLRPVLLVDRRAQVVVPPAHAERVARDALCDTPHDHAMRIMQCTTQRAMQRQATRCVTHRSRHCLPTRPGSCAATADQRGPIVCTSCQGRGREEAAQN
eukprot:scaffold103350_cov65-Phaeocystis_antarctica.AAC.2